MREARRLGPLAAVAMTAAGCTGNVHPSAATLAAQLADDPSSVDAVSLERRGFTIVPSDRWPTISGGICHEKARAHPVYGGFAGVDVVRVCIGEAGLPPVVFAMHTHGKWWTEVYPNDMRGTNPAEGHLDRVSDETNKRLNL